MAKVTYWVTTILIFILDGVLPVLTVNTEMAKESMHHLGYPLYFNWMLTGFKVIGAILLVLPMVKGRLKEWVYAGFTFNLISAAVSIAAVDGITSDVAFPVVAMVILAVSYVSYHKLEEQGKFS